jgi:uncharacterized DUF497 family protein
LVEVFLRLRLPTTCVHDPVLIVVFTVRKLGRDKETIRIISARQTSKKEREAYRRLKN